ncbi:MAG: phosphatidylserine decarboxylase [Syntrophaceae bacterium]
MRHQYVERDSGRIRTERLYGDGILKYVCPREREDSSRLYRVLTSRRMTDFLAYVNFDAMLGARLSRSMRFMRTLGIDLAECLDDPATFDTPRKVFERRIRYQEERPMPRDPSIVLSPCDARLLVGNLSETMGFMIKDKLFDLEELLGPDGAEPFIDGGFAVLRLTPDKYHYNHCPVSGTVKDIYILDGRYAPCNPGCVIRLAQPYSKNRRVVTIIDSDHPGGSGIGLVAMVEVVALMIGDIIQAYSEDGYDQPSQVTPGMFLRRGQPKSLFRPGSSTVVLLFQKDRVAFDDDIVRNQNRHAQSRFALGFGRPLVETEVRVRSGIARPRPREEEGFWGKTMHGLMNE